MSKWARCNESFRWKVYTDGGLPDTNLRLAVDDAGKKYELEPDPMNEEIQEQLKDIVVGQKVENMFREMIAGSGAIKATIHKYVNA